MGILRLHSPVPTSYRWAGGLKIYMVLFDWYYFSFTIGAACIISLTGILIDASTIWLFGRTRISLFFGLMDTVMLILSFFALWFTPTLEYWIVISSLYSVYLMTFSLFGFFKGYEMITKNGRILMLIANAILFVGYIVYTLSCREIINKTTGLIIISITIPLPFVITGKICFKIIKTIQSNPIYRDDPKQKYLLQITKLSLLAAILFGIPCVVLAFLAGIMKNARIIEFAMFLTLFCKLIISIVSFLIALNRSRDSFTCATGGSVFKI